MLDFLAECTMMTMVVVVFVHFMTITMLLCNVVVVVVVIIRFTKIDCMKYTYMLLSIGRVKFNNGITKCVLCVSHCRFVRFLGCVCEGWGGVLMPTKVV